MQKNSYPGIYDDHYGGMTPVGNIIKDAWLFGLIPETETCKGWNHGRIQGLYDQVHREWEKYGFLASKLPPELAERHKRIHDEAIQRARDAGWSPEMHTDAD